MPDELEQRLERALGAVAPPGPEARERALEAALAAMPPAAARGRRRRRLLVPAVACAVAFVFGGVTLAANGGRLPLVGTAPRHHDRTPRTPRRDGALVLPRGAVAVSAQAGGLAWLTTGSGAAMHWEGLGALAVSPGAVWALTGAGSTLHAVSLPDARPGFSRTVPGTVVAAAWAPAGIRIAYVVQTRHGDRVYDMYGNGRHAFLVAAHTAPFPPTWRWDSLAFAYVHRGGAVVVHDVIDGATAPVPRGCGIRRPAAIAFAPYGGLLAIADRAGRVRVVDTLHHDRSTCLSDGGAGVPKIAWLDPRSLVVGRGTTITRYVVGLAGGADVTDVPGRVAGIAAAPGGRRIALALRAADGGVRVVEARTPRFSEASHPLQVYRVLIAMGRLMGPVALGWQ